MAHFARLNSNNEVTHVSVVDNSILQDEFGNESEDVGIQYLKSIHGEDTIWKQTSYNSSIRKNYAGVGYVYNEQLDAFIPPSPYPSWILNEDTGKWEPPVPKPETTRENYLGPFWDEENQKWFDIDFN